MHLFPPAGAGMLQGTDPRGHPVAQLSPAIVYSNVRDVETYSATGLIDITTRSGDQVRTNLPWLLHYESTKGNGEA